MNVDKSPVMPDTQKMMQQAIKQQRKAQRRDLRRSMSFAAWSVCGMLLCANVLVILLQVFGMLTSPAQSLTVGMSSEMYYLMQCVAVAVGTPLSFVVFAVVKEIDFSDYLRFERVKFGRSLLYIGFGVLICMLANFPAQMLSEWITDAGYTDITLSLPSASSPVAAVAFAMGIAVLPPLAEEFAFRGIVLSHLRRHGDFLAVMVSALLFALVHGNVVQIPFAFLAGIALGVAYVKTNNLVVPIVIHMINNGLSVATQLILEYAGAEAANTISGAAMLILLFLGCVSVIIMLVKTIRGDDLLHLDRAKDNLVHPLGRLWVCLSSSGFLVLLGYTVLSCAVSLMV